MGRRRTAVHVCSTPGCPNLSPCSVHSRPKNAPWSDRDKAAHDRWQRRVKSRDGYRCTICGTRDDISAHHLRPGWDPADGVTLCKDHHRQVDTHAR